MDFSRISGGCGSRLILTGFSIMSCGGGAGRLFSVSSSFTKFNFKAL